MASVKIYLEKLVREKCNCRKHTISFFKKSLGVGVKFRKNLVGEAESAELGEMKRCLSTAITDRM